MKRKCMAFMDVFFALDKNERIPLRLTLHLLACKDCRSAVRRFSLLEKKCSGKNLKVMDRDSRSVVDIMRRLDNEYKSYDLQKEKVSLGVWVAAGISLLLCMVIFELLAGVYSSDFMTFTMSLFFALSIIVYCIVFVCSNMDFFIKKWKIE